MPTPAVKKQHTQRHVQERAHRLSKRAAKQQALEGEGSPGAVKGDGEGADGGDEEEDDADEEDEDEVEELAELEAKIKKVCVSFVGCWEDREKRRAPVFRCVFFSTFSALSRCAVFCTISSVCSPLHSLLCTLSSICSPLYALCTLSSALFSALSPLYALLCTLSSALSSALSPLYTLLCTLSSIRSPLHSLLYTLFSALSPLRSPLHSLLCTLSSARCPLRAEHFLALACTRMEVMSL